MKVLCLLVMLNCSGEAKLPESNPSSYYLIKSQAPQKYLSKIISLPSNTYGYEIYTGKKLFIRQVNIPGMPGNTGFQRKADAIKIAKLVITKLEKGVMPPTIDKKEMDQLHIKY